MPPLEFTYSQPQIQQEILTLDSGSQGNLPEGLDGSSFRWVDLDGEGLSGILSDAGGGWYYKRNLSANNLILQPDGTLTARASFGPLETVAGLPSRSDLSATRLLDLSGSGRLTSSTSQDPTPDSSSGRRTEPSSRCSDSPRYRCSTGRTRTSNSSTSPATDWPTS